MSEQPKDDPKVVSCPKCAGRMFNCTFTVTPDGLWTIGERVERGWVCGSCGYTVFYASKYETIIAVSERKKKLREMLNPKNWGKR